MKPLPTKFRYHRFDFHQIMRAGDVVLLSKTRPNLLRPSYEVVVVRRCPEISIAGRVIPSRECLPRAEMWGTCGWTYVDLESAWAKFRQLTGGDAPPDCPSPLPPLTQARPRAATAGSGEARLVSGAAARNQLRPGGL